MIYGDHFIPIHTMVAEMGSQEAMFVCFSSLSSSLTHQLAARIHWLLAINGAATFPSQFRLFYISHVQRKHCKCIGTDMC